MYKEIIDKYYPATSPLRDILVTHSRSVADKALSIARCHPEWNLDLQFIEEAAMLHDIGIFRCDAAGIQCLGTEPYIRHGVIGADILRSEGYPRHARVCERHTGAGLTRLDIEEQDLPLPHRDLIPETHEEQIICFADKFFSKTRLTEEKTLEQALHSLSRFGPRTTKQFLTWTELFAVR